MAANLVQDKAEQALQVVIRQADISGLDDGNVFTSFNSSDATVATHSVSIIGQGGLEDGYGSGNYRLSITVQVSSTLDVPEQDSETDPLQAHRDLAGAVFDLLSDDTLFSMLSIAIADFTVFDSIERRHGRQRTDNRKAVSEMLLEFTAVPSTIAAE